MKLEKNATIITADRHEVEQATHWDDSSGSDYFFEPDLAQISGTGNAEDLSDRGWTTTSLTFVNGTGAKFLDADNIGTPAPTLPQPTPTGIASSRRFIVP